MRWLVDGYNVIRCDPELSAREGDGLEAGRAALLRRLARLAARVSDPFTVVFDGARPTGGGSSGGKVQVVFSRPPETADDVLRRLATTLREGAVVVSSDRAVQHAARRAGAVVVGAQAFLRATSPEGLREDAEDAEDDNADPPERRGPSRRPSREERDTRRVLRRLTER
jgi:predicted RNA-binding protein with PIN domain